jgi:hypothetical protein
MTIRRADFSLIKPGRMQDHVALFHEVCSNTHRLGAGKVVLNRESVAGIGQPMVYSFVDFDSMDAYGEFMDAALGDDALQASWQKLFAEDSPSTFLGTSLLTELVTYGPEPEGQPGTAAIVRRWNGTPEATDAILGVWEKFAPHVQQHGGFNGVWRLYVSGDATGDLITGVAFPNMAALGKWQTFVSTNDEAIKLTGPFLSADPPARHINASIDIVVASSTG